jgi:hypothetical protein
MKISQSSDYSQFEFITGNRPIDQRKVKKLVHLMSAYGWLPSHPAMVCREGSRYQIKDGQHRIAAAKALKIPILFVEDNSDISVADLNEPQSGWKTSDYIESYDALGYPEYKQLKAFAKIHGIPYTCAASLLAGETFRSKNQSRMIKSGKFKIKASDYANLVMRIGYAIVEFAGEFGRSQNSLIAISRLLFVPGFSPELFISRIQTGHHMLRNQATVDQFTEMFESVYNYKTTKAKRLPLRHLVMQAMEARSPLNGGSASNSSIRLVG